MSHASEQLPDDLASARALQAQERARRIKAEADAASQGTHVALEALIACLKMESEKVRRELYGSRSERKPRVLEQMELQLEELEADADEDELAVGDYRQRIDCPGVRAQTSVAEAIS